jgi:hypothetical protein
MRPIRASEIGTYLFCQRAWWYQGQGIETENQSELAEGTLFHRRHGQKVMAVGLLRVIGWILLLGSVAVLAVALTVYLFY